MTKTKPELMENHGVPSSLDHLSLLSAGAELARRKTIKQAKSHEADLRMLGTCLCALYQAATCHRGCNKGPHLLEALCARAYNQACAAYHLLTLGFYDESLNLVRGIGEIYHFVALSTVDRSAVSGWIEADRSTRIREFGPGKVRARLRKIAPELELTEQAWYPDLSERYTHMNPGISPGKHNPERAIAGGVFQQAGFELTLSELTQICCGLALMISRYFQFSDLFAEIKELLSEASEHVSDNTQAAARKFTQKIGGA